MAVLKLNIDEFDETSFYLIAIHTILEDFRLAYLINQKLPLLLYKSNEELFFHTKKGELHLSRFFFEDEETNISWNLIQNKYFLTTNETSINNGLFSETTTEFTDVVYFLPELKKADFFLKIENPNDSFNLQNINTQISTIEKVSMNYIVDTNTLKSRNNLIF